MQVNVNVTQDDLDKGEACSSCRCAVARACLRAVPEADHVSVEPQDKSYLPPVSITFCCPGWPHGSFTVLAPQIVAEFVDRYDRGKPVQPFSFQLDIPDPS